MQLSVFQICLVLYSYNVKLTANNSVLHLHEAHVYYKSYNRNSLSYRDAIL